jgi:hypothetical protein
MIYIYKSHIVPEMSSKSYITNIRKYKEQESTHQLFYTAARLYFSKTRAVCKVRGLAAVHRCYAEGGSDCFAKL